MATHTAAVNATRDIEMLKKTLHGQLVNSICFLVETTSTLRVGYGSLRTTLVEDCEVACEADAAVGSFRSSSRFENVR